MFDDIEPKKETYEEKQRRINHDDYSEYLLRHIIRDGDVYNAVVQHDVIPSDFITSDIAGIKTYKELALTIFNDIGHAPIARETLKLAAKAKGEKKLGCDIDSLNDFLDKVYVGDVIHSKEDVIKELPDFVKFRRNNKVMAKKIVDPDVLLNELSKVHQDVQKIRVKNTASVLSPFETIVKQEIVNVIPTGIKQIDLMEGCIARGELGLIIGHSGSGKTALATWLALQAAIYGYNVLYISGEEKPAAIAARWYAQKFGEEPYGYTKIFRGKAESWKQQKFGEMTQDDKEKLGRLRVVDATQLAPFTPSTLYAKIESLAKEGFIPDVVFVDQMDYMVPDKVMPRNSQRWAEQIQIAFECDLLLQNPILGEHEIGMWLIHQGTGERKWLFGFGDIAGGKGIVRPTDISLGVGREPKDEDDVTAEEEEDEKADHINLFSMKVRNSKHFQIPLHAEFKFMRFAKAKPGFKTKVQQEKEEVKAAKAARTKMERGKGRDCPIPEEKPAAKTEEAVK